MMDNSIKRNEALVLLNDARERITSELLGRKPLYEAGESEIFTQTRGVFVTLHLEGRLRGCIGNIEGHKPLRQAVRDLSASSAFRDPRFPPLSLSEVKDISIEISILSPLKEIESAGDFRPGTDGILLKKDSSSALFLPQVATEQGWNREETLSQLCRKAGLPLHAWQLPDITFFVFQATVISEKEYF
jgi:AmmeMemoRadiSam system protein A